MSRGIQVGDKFGRLTVIGDLGQCIKAGTKKPYHYFKCECKCGAEVDVNGLSLVSGRTKSCGHCNEREIIGKRFGALVVESPYGRTDKGDLLLNCRCDCGNITVVRYTNLVKDGGTRSCGECYDLLPESYKPEIKARIRKLSSIWRNMNSRCNDSNNHAFQSYGGRGIQCNISRMDFIKAYYLDDSFQLGLEADRIDNNDDYKFENIRWVTKSENMMNTVIKNKNSHDSIASRLLTLSTFTLISNKERYNISEFTIFKLVSDTINDSLYLFLHKTLIDQQDVYINKIKEYYRKNNTNIYFRRITSHETGGE